MGLQKSIPFSINITKRIVPKEIPSSHPVAAIYKIRSYNCESFLSFFIEVLLFLSTHVIHRKLLILFIHLEFTC